MKYDELLEIVKTLPFDSPKTIYQNDDNELFILRPSKVSNNFKHYDINKNFQIFLKELGSSAFRPNHLRILISLNLWKRNNPEIIHDLLLAFDKIFYGEDPNLAIEPLHKYELKSGINDIETIAHLAQLFIVEQNYGYAGVSNYDPPSLYLQGWIRTFIASDHAIDNIIWRICRNTPPAKMFTAKDNKKESAYEENPIPLWYLK